MLWVRVTVVFAHRGGPPSGEGGRSMDLTDSDHKQPQVIFYCAAELTFLFCRRCNHELKAKVHSSISEIAFADKNQN